eukprot:Rhum_TRINITY_DN23386_c0_g1::Rhum_TRINITY_DN23386_c0_g1_i1::g.177839::m.177839
MSASSDVIVSGASHGLCCASASFFRGRKSTIPSTSTCLPIVHPSALRFRTSFTPRAYADGSSVRCAWCLNTKRLPAYGAADCSAAGRRSDRVSRPRSSGAAAVAARFFFLSIPSVASRGRRLRRRQSPGRRPPGEPASSIATMLMSFSTSAFWMNSRSRSGFTRSSPHALSTVVPPSRRGDLRGRWLCTAFTRRAMTRELGELTLASGACCCAPPPPPRVAADMGLALTLPALPASRPALEGRGGRPPKLRSAVGLRARSRLLEAHETLSVGGICACGEGGGWGVGKRERGKKKKKKKKKK